MGRLQVGTPGHLRAEVDIESTWSQYEAYQWGRCVDKYTVATCSAPSPTPPARSTATGSSLARRQRPLVIYGLMPHLHRLRRTLIA